MRALVNDPSHWLSTFKIELGAVSDAAYNNGNQQIMVVMRVQAIDGAVITDDDLETLVPVELLGDGSYRVLPPMDDDVTWGWTTTLDERFDFYDGQTQQRTNDQGNGLSSVTSQPSPLLSKTIYIQTRAAANRVLVLHAQITDKDGNHYRTENNFLSSVSLRSIRRPDFQFPDDYQWSLAASEGNWEDGARYINEHRLSPRRGSFVSADLLDPIGNVTHTDGMLKWQSADQDDAFATNVGFALPNNQSVKYHPSFEFSQNFRTRRRDAAITSTKGAIVVVLQGDNDLSTAKPHYQYDRPCKLRALDNNGNVHEISVAFEDEGLPEYRRAHLALTIQNQLPADAWLAGFDISVSSSSRRAYNNGLQQIEVTLSVLAAQGQTITQAQMDSTALVIEQPDGTWTLLSSEGDASDWWYSTARDDRFHYLPAWVEEPSAQRLSSGLVSRQKTFYIQTTAEGATTLNLSGSIQQFSDVPGSQCLTAGGVNLEAVEPPHYSTSDYHWRLVCSKSHSANPHRVLNEYELRLAHVAFSYATFDTPADQGMLLLGTHPKLTAHVGVALPGSRTVHHNDNIDPGQGFHARRVAQLEHCPAGTIVFVVQTDDEIPRNPGSQNTGPCALTAFDRYGNRHQLMVGFNSDYECAERLPRLTLLSNNQQQQPHSEAVANITHFQVMGVGLGQHDTVCRLYNNGYQQTYVDIRIQATDQQGSNIDLGELAKQITLVRYADLANLKTLGYNYSQQRSELDELFSYYPSTLAPDTSIGPAANTIRFWIKTQKAENLQVGARLQIGNTIYHTCDPQVAEGGRTVAGKSNSRAVIMPVQKNYRITDSQIDLKRIDHDGSTFWDVDLYEFKFSDAARPYYIVYSTPEDDVFVYDYIGNGQSNRSTYFKRDKERSVNFGSNSYWEYYTTINKVSGVMYASRMKMKLQYEYGPEYTRSLAINLIDQYGNSHPFTIGPSGYSNDGTNTISLRGR